MTDATSSTDASPSSSPDEMSLPHSELYTRLGVSGDGIGVFAIRDIPMDTVLFAGDNGQIARVTAQDVAEIEDEAVRKMYLDFCPVIDGAYVAPRSFNQLTMGWYLNHSDDPNVVGGTDLVFRANRFIARGEELRVDYTTYSEHARSRVGAWKDERA